jgi:hypothetical protein
MYGIVNLALEDFLRARFGEAAWRDIRRTAGAPAEFVRMKPYPDSITYAVVSATVERSGEPVEPLLREFGRHWIGFARRSGHGEFLQLVGRDLPSFLENLDAMHARLGLTFPQMDAPSFRVKRVGPGEVEVGYTSSRPGLVPFVEGLLSGLTELFATDIAVDVLAPRDPATGTVLFRVRYGPAAVRG